MTAISTSDNRAILYQTDRNIDDTDTISNKEKTSLAGFSLSAIDIHNIINNSPQDEAEKSAIRRPDVKSYGKVQASDVKNAFEDLLTSIEKKEKLFNFSLSDEDLASIADTINRFEITKLANGYTGNQDSLLLAMVKAALSQSETCRQLANMETKIAYDSIKSSASNTVMAAQEGQKQAITTAMVSLAMAGTATFDSIKSLKNQISSLKLHETQSVKHSAAATEHRNAALNASRDPDINNEAVESLMAKSHELQNKAQFAQVAGREAQKIFVASNAVQQNSASVGQMAGQQHATAQAEKSGQSQMDSAQERTFSEVAQISKKNHEESIALVKKALEMFLEES
ncbi:hypothetical protein CBG25_04375, partial [Arsenophonus sp. ENCA]|uniref:hypothetical protein n=1 Tax=Arsenophonus sp. ENCA TaxID=1987579 RepID=UPI000BD05D13